MKYRFNEFNNVTGYIREILGNFNLPTIDVITDDSYLFEGKYYIKELGIYLCTASGTAKTAKLKFIMSYYFNKPLLDLSTTLSINEHSYDTKLHEYLGKYLRFIRDYKKLNLMPLYNCFGNRALNISYTPKNSSVKFKILKDDPQYTYYSIPVRLNQVYTIGIDSIRPIEAACILYNNSIIRDLYESDSKKSNKVDNLVAVTYTKLNCSLRKPTLYTKLRDLVENNNAIDFLNNYHDIVLVLKVPTNNNSSLVVLEGDYVSTNSSTPDKLISYGWFGSTNNADYLKNYPSKLSLFSVNDHLHHPFADRLIEYLFDSAITNLEELDENIMRTQLNILNVMPFRNRKVKNYGIWSQEINKSIYDIINESYMSYKQEEKYITNKPFKVKNIPFYAVGRDSEGYALILRKIK